MTDRIYSAEQGFADPTLQTSASTMIGKDAGFATPPSMSGLSKGELSSVISSAYDLPTPRKQRLYLAGPMRGIELDNFPAFARATQDLRDDGYDVFSPAERDLAIGYDPEHPEGFDLRDALNADLAYVTRRADGVAVLPGWEASAGAYAEVTTANALGLPVRTVEAWLMEPYREDSLIVLRPLGGPQEGTVERVVSATGGEKDKKLAELGSMDPLPLLRLAEVSGYGARKYATFNYLKGYDWSLTFNAMQRHLLAFWNGEDMDPESGLPHAAHAMWHCGALVSFMERGLGTDDRYKQPEN